MKVLVTLGQTSSIEEASNLQNGVIEHLGTKEFLITSESDTCMQFMHGDKNGVALRQDKLFTGKFGKLLGDLETQNKN